MLHVYQWSQLAQLPGWDSTANCESLQYVGSPIFTHSSWCEWHCRPMYLVGYIPAHNQVYVADKSLNIYGYSLSLSYIEYQMAVLWGDLDATAEILCPSVMTIPPGTDTTPKSHTWAQPTGWPLSHQCLTTQRSKSRGIIVMIQARE